MHTGNQYTSFNGILVGKITGLGYSLNEEDQQFITRKTINHKICWVGHVHRGIDNITIFLGWDLLQNLVDLNMLGLYKCVMSL
jgi:hypothetical protein